MAVRPRDQPAPCLIFLSHLPSLFICSALCTRRKVHYSAYRSTDGSDYNMVEQFLLSSLCFSCLTSPAVFFPDEDVVEIISLTPTVAFVHISSAVQIEERWKDALLPLLALSRSLITHCGSSLHLALLHIPSLPLCFSFSPSPSLLRSPSISQPRWD